MMQWLPLHLLNSEDAQSILKTFQEIFPHTSIWNSFLTRIVLLVGSKEKVILDKIRFEEIMRLQKLKKSAQQIGINSFLDFTDFFLTDGSRVNSFVQSADVITDDRPRLEFSSVTLLPPLKWQVDETFLNFLRHRIDHHPQLRGLIASEKKRWEKQFSTRTAQRFSIFSKRYHGPGEHDFKSKNYLAGLKAVKTYLDKKENAVISLKHAQWK